MLDENLIQIAGVIDAAEAEMLQQCGIRYLGFPLRLPVHREDLTEEEAAQISHFVRDDSRYHFERTREIFPHVLLL
jgi:hypothetical protein